MKLAKQTATILLDDSGKQVLALAAFAVPESGKILVEVEESEDLGLWIRLNREDGIHFFLLRWKYILGVDLEDAFTRVVGLQGEKGLG